MPYKNANRRRAYEKRRAASNYAYRKENGLCVDCGQPANLPRVHCATCGAKRSKAGAAKLSRLRKAWRAFGICLICGTREAMPQRSWCGYCSEIQLEGKKRV